MSNYYNRNAKLLFDKYRRLDPDSLHAHWLKRLPLKPGLALDVGGGSGRDSMWLAGMGWKVLVVEPAKTLLEAHGESPFRLKMKRGNSHPAITILPKESLVIDVWDKVARSLCSSSNETDSPV